MADTATLLPSSATSFERDLSASMDPLPRVGAAAELIRDAKRENIPDSVVPWLLVEYGLGELLPYLPDPRTAISTGVLWQRLRGTPRSFQIALGWINNSGSIEESEGGSINWSQFQLGLQQAPVDLSETDSIVEIGRLSSPVRSSLFRIYGGWYDGRRFQLDDHKLSSQDTLCDHTGVYLKDEWPQLSFGREFKNEDDNISEDLDAELGIHRANGISGRYEDRNILSNTILGEASWRTLHIEDLASVISRLHFGESGPWWIQGSDWQDLYAWDQVLDWAGLQNKFQPALKFARAGMYLSDYAELGDTNACFAARSLDEFGDGAVLLSEGDSDTGEHILSEHLSRVEFTEINERIEHQTQLGSMWIGQYQNQIELFPLTHGEAYTTHDSTNVLEHVTHLQAGTLRQGNWQFNNRQDFTDHIFGDGAGHQRGVGETWLSLGIGVRYDAHFDLDTIVIDEVAGTISGLEFPDGTLHTRPLFNADGVRRELKVVGEYQTSNGPRAGRVYVGTEVKLLPSHREHTRALAYDDSFELSRSRLSEFTPLFNEQAISRGHTTSALFPQPSSAWNDTGHTWNETLTWANFSQPEQILGFSLAGVCLSETGFLSDGDGELGDTQATLGFFEAERIERSHQTTSPAHNPSGVLYHLREHQRVLAYDDSFELSRTRLSEYIPLLNEQSITRERKTELTYLAGPFTFTVLNFSISHLCLSNTDAALGDTDAVLGWPTSQRFDRDYFAQATENRQSFTTRQHVRTYYPAFVVHYFEPTWSSGSWASDGAVGWAASSTEWDTSAWDANNWLEGELGTWANEPMWARIARWQVASLLVETQHQTTV